jgi:hypothetical protein
MGYSAAIHRLEEQSLARIMQRRIKPMSDEVMAIVRACNSSDSCSDVDWDDRRVRCLVRSKTADDRKN